MIKEIKQSVERIVFSFKCRAEHVQFGGIFSQPTKLCENIKSSIKEIALGKIRIKKEAEEDYSIIFYFSAIVKCVTLFELFALKQDKLSKSERHEIIREIMLKYSF